MGNAVSAAELAASQIINPNIPIPDYKQFDQQYYSSKDIPPECPIHRKPSPPSECPIHAGSGSTNDEINPFNMVRMNCLFSFFLYTVLWISQFCCTFNLNHKPFKTLKWELFTILGILFYYEEVGDCSHFWRSSLILSCYCTLNLNHKPFETSKRELFKILGISFFLWRSRWLIPLLIFKLQFNLFFWRCRLAIKTHHQVSHFRCPKSDRSHLFQKQWLKKARVPSGSIPANRWTTAILWNSFNF